MLALMAQELGDTLSSARVRDVRRSGKNGLWLVTTRADVWIDATPNRSVACISAPPPKTEKGHGWFSSRLDGGQVTSVMWLGGDRAIAVDVVRQDPIGTVDRTRLVIELGGKNTNAVLVDLDSDTVLDCLRPVTAKRNRYRELIPKAVYQPAPTFDRERLDGPIEWGRADADSTLIDFFAERTLAWSRPLVIEIAHRCGVDPQGAVGRLQASELERMQGALDDIISTPKPVMCLDDTGEPKDVLAFEPTAGQFDTFERLSSLSEGVLLVAQRRKHQEQRAQLARGIDSALSARQRFLTRKAHTLGKQMDDGSKADAAQHHADLLMAHQDSIEPRQTEIAIPDWDDPEGAEVTISLDAEKNAVGNAQRLYKRARKLRDGATINARRLAETENELTLVMGAAKLLETDPPLETLESLHGQWVTVNKMRRNKKSGPPEITPRRYRTSDGWLVLVGRNDRENDRLSLKVASPNDYWFHTHGSPGSHVVLRCEDHIDEPSRRTLEEAAALAGHWSKQKTSSKAAVIYTLAKYVTKPRGAKPGTVTVRREKLIMIEPGLLPEDDAVGEPPLL